MSLLRTYSHAHKSWGIIHVSICVSDLYWAKHNQRDTELQRRFLNLFSHVCNHKSVTGQCNLNLCFMPLWACILSYCALADG